MKHLRDLNTLVLNVLLMIASMDNVFVKMEHVVKDVMKKSTCLVIKRHVKRYCVVHINKSSGMELVLTVMTIPELQKMVGGV